MGAISTTSLSLSFSIIISPKNRVDIALGSFARTSASRITTTEPSSLSANAGAFTALGLSHRPLRALTKAAGCRPQALQLFLTRPTFLVESGSLRLLRIISAQLLERFTDGKLINFSHSGFS
jgi:hypothetical protein